MTKSHSRIKITEDEHRLITRYLEQCRSYNDGIATALKLVTERHAAEVSEEAVTSVPDFNQIFNELEAALAQLRKDTL